MGTALERRGHADASAPSHDPPAGDERDRVLASLLERALHADGRAVVVVRPNGSIAYASSAAWDLLAELQPAATRGRLPAALAGWLARQRSGGLDPPSPFVADGPSGRITARWLRAATRGDPDAVLLAREARAPCPESLASLGLSRRQAEVMSLVAQGRTNAQVALALGVSPRTVQKHLEHVYERLGVHTRAAATARSLGAPAAP